MTLSDAERAALEHFHAGQAVAGDLPSVLSAGLAEAFDPDGWITFALSCQLEVGRLLRACELDPTGQRWTKGDGTPATAVEERVEARLRERLAAFAPQAVFVGEESGGAVPDQGTAVAVDPVDGTWAFLTGIALWSSTYAVFRDGQAWLGAVSNPSTGEVAYAIRGGSSRALRLGAYGEGDRARSLPQREPGAGANRPLVLVHPSVGTEALRHRLDAAWAQGQLGVVRGAGGSPAWGLLEAARGHYVYVNAWNGRAVEPFDLAAAILVLRGAGGDAVDAQGRPVDERHHSGLLVAGVDRAARERVLDLVQGVDGLG